MPIQKLQAPLLRILATSITLLKTSNSICQDICLQNVRDVSAITGSASSPIFLTYFLSTCIAVEIIIYYIDNTFFFEVIKIPYNTFYKILHLLIDIHISLVVDKSIFVDNHEIFPSKN